MKIYRLVLISMILLMVTTLSGQNFTRPDADRIWINDNYKLDFTSGTLEISELNNSYYLFGSFTQWISDSVFVMSNGVTVVDSFASVIPGGDSLSYHESTFQDYEYTGLPGPDCVLMLPSFENPGFPKVFHQTIRRTLVPDTLDITSFIDNLLTTDVINDGGVIKAENKNTLRYENTLDQGLTAVRHGNGRDWWINLNSRARNEQHSILYSPEGVNHISTQQFTPDSLFIGIGQTVYSPDGKYLLKTKYRYPNDTSILNPATLLIYDFDRCTGVIKKKEYVNFPLAPVLTRLGVAVSPNSRFVYVNSGTDVVQYDLAAEDIKNSEVILFDVFEQDSTVMSEGIGFYTMRLAPDGKIYIGTQGSAPFWHVINRPNLKGDSSNFVYKAIEFDGFLQTPLPNFPPYGTGPLDGSYCDTLGISHGMPVAAYEYVTIDDLAINFYDSSSLFVEEYAWSFGDGGISNQRHPIHTYAVGGTYEVCLEVFSENGSDIVCKNITIGTVSLGREYFSQTSQIKIWPNPADEYITVEFDYKRCYEKKVFIYDSIGRCVKNIDVGQDRKLEISTRNLEAGVYFLKFSSECNKTAISKKIILY